MCSGYRRHMESVRRRLADAMGKTLSRLEPLGMRPWLVPAGVDAAAVAHICLKDNVILAPGNTFSQSQTAKGFLRFNVAQSTDEKIFAAMARALDACSRGNVAGT